jgi:drug/metabolite transporter (DMT)-like permease
VKRFSSSRAVSADPQAPELDSTRGSPPLLVPIALSLVAFAANSIFCRLALMGGGIDPDSFTAIRLASGTVFLLILLRLTVRPRAPGGSWKGAACLFLYAYLFSTAYVELGAGAGALVLFGAVQVTMFLFSWIKGEQVTARVWIGMLIAFGGLVTLLLPGANTPAMGSVALMLMSGVAWGVYSLIGKGSVDPLADTAGHFARSLPLVACLVVVTGLAGSWHMNAAGVLYALGSGVLASGAGYAIWGVLPGRARIRSLRFDHRSGAGWGCVGDCLRSEAEAGVI